MEKLKLLTVFLLCLGIAGIAWSAEVISIDLNGDDSAAYEGDGAYTDGDIIWRAYYTGTGKPMGSARSADLPDWDDINTPSTYAAGVWITDDVTNHTYVTGSALMDDGFDASGTPDPCFVLFAFPDTSVDPNSSDGRAFGGTFDIYVYGREAGTIKLSTPRYGPNTHTLTGGYTGSFVEGQNYSIFYDVLIDDTNEATIEYSNYINGLQLVSKKQPIAASSSFVVEAEDWDVAYETNGRGGEVHDFGPDVATYDMSYGEVGIGYLDWGENMTYDLTVDAGNVGQYEITGWVRTENGECNNLDLYLDEDIYLGTLYQLNTEIEFVRTQNTVTVNLFEGSHTLKWVCEGPEIYFDLDKFDVELISSDPNLVDCDEVYQYKKNYANDFDGDCDVDANDIAYITGDNWLNCYSPDPNDC